MRFLGKSFLLIVVIILLSSGYSYSQLGKRLTIGEYEGYTKGMGTTGFSQNGLPQDVFGGFGGIVGGVNVMYSQSKHWEFGGDLHGVTVSKTNYKLGMFSIGPQIQFNLLPSDKNIIPYVSGSANVSFLGLSQSAYSKTISPQASYSNGSPDMPVTSIQNQNQAIKQGINGVFGYKFNAGVTVKLNNKFYFFGEAGFNSVLTGSNSGIKNNFPDSKGNFNYIAVVIGIKVNLLKSTTLF